MLHEPTADPTAIVSAIDSVSLDSTGVESTFRTVAEIARQWGKYKDSQGHYYQPMIIVVTDEVGDDEALLEDTIHTARSAHAPVYVLGSQALTSTLDTLRKRIADFETQTELAASADFPLGE